MAQVGRAVPKERSFHENETALLGSKKWIFIPINWALASELFARAPFFKEFEQVGGLLFSIDIAVILDI